MATFGDMARKCAQAEDPLNAALSAMNKASISLPTLGGKQFWTDQLVFHGWRIQQNAITGDCRLLDDRDWQQAGGTFDECRAKLDQIKRDRKLPPMSGTVVLLLHGLFRARSSMESLGKYVEGNSKLHACTFGYASTRGDVGAHAAALASVIEHLDGVEEIHFVAHSLGNLVIRHYLADHTDPKTGQQADPRIKRLVMLGPPNNGAQLATTLNQNELFETVVGASGQQLGKGWAEFEKTLATPACEFGIIAGGRGEKQGYNPLLPGDNDLVVTVDSTKLPGARDFLLLPVAHTFLMFNDKAQAATLNFLQNGYFVSAEKRQPIEKK